MIGPLDFLNSVVDDRSGRVEKDTMADAELEAIRQRRMQELMAQQGGGENLLGLDGTNLLPSNSFAPRHFAV